MQLPSIFQGESRTRLLQGAIFGAVATLLIGFVWGGWVIKSTAEKQSVEAAESAVVTALAPICVDNFQNATEASTNLENLKKESSYMQTGFIEKGGWAVLPGSDKASYGVARACAELLNGS
ncbi:hypothetical protein [Sneathiella sp.]|uniref:hypothetical protein n=1 Tax=Sneathiella sp. TaxID=1964365 RepID=UPI0035655AD6